MVTSSPDSLIAMSEALVATADSADGAALITGQLEGILSSRIPFRFDYQPIVDLKRGLVAGYEALVRFAAEPRMSPDRWFNEADKRGLRLPLEDLVLRRALHARTQLPANCFLSLNASPCFLLSDLWGPLLDAMPDWNGMVVEITENELITEYQAVLERIAMIRSRGGYIAVDDAGSGYSSLKHVMELKPDFVKLDRSFVNDCDCDRARAALIEMLGMAAGRLDAWVIAEGVEKETELAELIRLRTPLAQGYYLSRPGPEMCALDAAKTGGILARVRDCDRTDSVSSSMETAMACRNLEEAYSRLAQSAGPAFAVVLDRWRRPRNLVERHAAIGIREIGDFRRVHVLGDAREALTRALTRPEDQRFDPLAVINDQGEFQGIARIDRLMQQMLAAF